ncbi:hypothetical protein Dda_5393 [Drechslerella dactyloides]|uniref:Riboflavin aldehyde-forming enzyme n=1 Tax=Drechslerella dactyloides TaxID=74499 RepID=A0AAD6IW52_DREDA|nr:hypothetical protein Dda_5393 [Drechslerella dactyloides]
MDKDIEALSDDASKPLPPPPSISDASSLPVYTRDENSPPEPSDQKKRKQWTITVTLPSREDIGTLRLRPVYEKETLSQPARIFGIRRRWFLTAVGLLALIILIIGLAAGLAGKKNKGTFLPLPNSGQSFHGDATYYDTGLGACGWDNPGTQKVVAVSHALWDAKSTSANPNNNPLCGLMIRATRYRANNEAFLIGQGGSDAPGGRNVSVDVKVVDRCVGCAPTDLDFSRSAFDELADQVMGRVLIDWAWL